MNTLSCLFPVSHARSLSKLLAAKYGDEVAMCGIFCSVSRHDYVTPSPEIKQLLDARGPDASCQVLLSCQTGPSSRSTLLTCYCTVLSLRGRVPVQQPLQSTGSNSTLCWNGEAWTISRERPEGNDTTAVLDLIRDSFERQTVATDAGMDLAAGFTAISGAMSRIAGPYAFVFYHESSSKLYFGRDFLGRRSLLYHVNPHGDVLLSSIADSVPGLSWKEVEADGIYCFDLVPSLDASTSEKFVDYWGDFSVFKAPYCLAGSNGRSHASVISSLSLNRDLSTSIAMLHANSESVSTLYDLLCKSVSSRVVDIPDPTTFTGETEKRKGTKLAVLFSGGLDCTVLARLSHELLPASEPIDLLNVAFENPRIHKTLGELSYEHCPDRATGRASYTELCRTCPGREWRFVEINIPYHETVQHRQQVIALMHPHSTEMDLSIAYALYFAARGIGKVSSNKSSEPSPYATTARVLLSGLGADELFAGYTRHATAFNRHGLNGLLDELDLDIGRMAKRNLGRDDRIMSNWSREVRFPFLDENLMEWALAAPVGDKCDFGRQACIGSVVTDQSALLEPGKKVLRCLAWKLGMLGVAREKKRAIQFGARTAKMETGKTRGTTLLP